MRLEIKGLAELRARLEQLRPAEIMAAALAAEAERLAQSVRDGLATPPGAGDHDKPWAQNGALRDSIAATAEGLEASVGSNDPAAAPQEMGTSRLPPRPFLAPVAAQMGEDVAGSVGSRVAAALRGDPSDPNIIPASAEGSDTGVALLGAILLGGAYMALRGSDPHSRGPTRPPPLMNQSPDQPAEQSDARPKPEFRPNAVHGSRLRPGKTREPSDSQEVYENAERDPREKSNKLYGRNREGEWYQYHDDNAGGAHYAGTIDQQAVPPSILKGRK